MVAMIFAIFFNSHVAYLEPVTAGSIAVKVASAVGVLVIVSFAVVVIDIVAILHKKLQLANQQNIKMLDGMHEGLLILNKAKATAAEQNSLDTRLAQSVAFINRPAQKLINGFLGHGIDDKTEASLNRIIKINAMAPLKKDANKPTFLIDQPVSLEQIIVSQLDEPN